MEGGDSTACIPWLQESIFQYCATSNWQVAAHFLGFASIGCWFCAQTPQLYENVKIGHVEALNGYFLAFWLIGDVFNLTGAVLTKQMETQILLAAYFCSLDLVLLLQYTYYVIKSALLLKDKAMRKISSQERLENDNDDDSDNSDNEGDDISPLIRDKVDCDPNHRSALSCFASVMIPLCTIGLQATIPKVGNEGDLEDDDNAALVIVGYVMGCVSAVFYLFSRIPQIYQNFKRKTTKGLAPFMFALTFGGNVTYGSSILLTSTEHSFIMSKLPWLVGSLGTVAFDLFLLFQTRLYKK